ncbi:MAG: hypothetical protein Q8P03_01360 [bacterium]|nr:hypothetical protein [bacterium]
MPISLFYIINFKSFKEGEKDEVSAFAGLADQSLDSDLAGDLPLSRFDDCCGSAFDRDLGGVVDDSGGFPWLWDLGDRLLPSDFAQYGLRPGAQALG